MEVIIYPNENFEYNWSPNSVPEKLKMFEFCDILISCYFNVKLQFVWMINGLSELCEMLLTQYIIHIKTITKIFTLKIIELFHALLSKIHLLNQFLYDIFQH